MKIKALRAFRLGTTTFQRGAEADVSDPSAADLSKRGLAVSVPAKNDPLDHDDNGRKGGAKGAKASAKRSD